MSDFDGAMRLSEEIGELKGRLLQLGVHNEALESKIESMHETQDALRTRAVAAETELAVVNKSLKQIERLKL